MVTWTAARPAQQHARPARTAEPAVAPGTGGTEAPWHFADGCMNLAFMTSASPSPGRPGRDVHHLVECRRSRTKGRGPARGGRGGPGRNHVTVILPRRSYSQLAGPPWSTRVTSCSDEQEARCLVCGRTEG